MMYFESEQERQSYISYSDEASLFLKAVGGGLAKDLLTPTEKGEKFKGKLEDIFKSKGISLLLGG